MKLEDKELLNVEGGAILPSSFFANFTNIFKTIYNIGNELGGAIRRIASKNVCPLS